MACLDFLQGHRSNFLLASGAAGRMPRHLQIEAGFDEEVVSSLETSQESAIESELAAVKKLRTEMSVAMKHITEHLSKKTNGAQEQKFELVERYSKMMEDEKVLKTMSPPSKEVYVDGLKKKRKRLLHEIANDKT